MDRLLYLSPETIRSHEQASGKASDVWSLGVTLYVLATGRFPFKNVNEIFESNLSWPSSIPLSEPFKMLVAGMLAKD